MEMKLFLFSLIYWIKISESLIGGSRPNETYCESISLPHSSDVLCCFNNTGHGKCLPSLIIAGTQKSGTTALAVELSTHPLISFSIKKELHFFDRLESYEKGVSSYFDKFHYFHPSTLSETEQILFIKSQFQMPIFTEATPFYLASRDACQRISETIPNVKLIILLRDPIDRAYSEYQMKIRRVEKQNEFIQLAKYNSLNLLNCLELHPNDIPMLTKCLPSELSEHSHYKRFLNSMNELYLNEYKETRIKLKTLKEQSINTSIQNLNNNNNEQLDHDAVSNLKLVAWQHMVHTCFKSTPERLNPAPRSTSSSIKNSPIRNVSNLKELSPIQIPVGSFPISSPFDNFQFHSSFNIPRSYFSNNESLVHPHNQPLYFQPLACMGKNAKETFQPLEHTFQQEMSDFHSCAGENIFSESLELIDQKIEKCIKVKHGISSQYLYRSLYAPQIFHCLKFLPKEQFLFLSSESLKGFQHHDTMQRIWDFLHIPPNPYSILNNSSNSTTDSQYSHWIQNSLNQIFPDFENNTGWRLQSSYNPLPLPLRDKIHSFLEPLEQKLNELIGFNLTNDWKRL